METIDSGIDRLSDMTLFVAVVDAGGFSAAARRLGIAKSTVSKRVRRLEDRLGARLLHRTTRHVSLTDVGQAFHLRARHILSDAVDAEAEVFELQSTLRGTLRISLPQVLGPRYVVPALVAFQGQHPRIALDLDLSDRLVDLVADAFDLAVRISHLRDSSLVMRRLGSTRLVMVASPAYLARRGRPKDFKDLGAHDCMRYSLSDTPHIWRFTDGDRPQRLHIRGPVMASSGTALMQAAVAGAGIVLLPDFLVGEQVRSGALETLFDGRITDETPVSLVYPDRRHLSVKTRALIEFLVEWFRTNPWCCGS